MKLYMAVTADKYELPICVEETYYKLAEWAGVSPQTVQSSISRGCSGKYTGIRFIRIETEEQGGIGKRK